MRAAAPPRRRFQSTGRRYAHGPARLEVERDVLHLLEGHRARGHFLDLTWLGLGLGLGLELKVKGREGD